MQSAAGTTCWKKPIPDMSSNIETTEASAPAGGSTASPVPIELRDVSRYEGRLVEIRGWLYNLRKSGKIVFPIIRDGSGMIQCVAVKSNLPEQVFDALKNLTQESSVIVTGTVRAEARAAGGYELDVTGAAVVQRVSEEHPYPLTPKEHGVD